METIKIIDLFVKIANGEGVPEKIKYRGILYTYDKKDVDYYCGDCDEYYNDALLLPHIRNTREFLNDEVEIIEDTPKEDKKIEKLKKKKTIDGSFEGHTTYIYKYNEYEIGNKINEIIDKINGEYK